MFDIVNKPHGKTVGKRAGETIECNTVAFGSGQKLCMAKVVECLRERQDTTEHKLPGVEVELLEVTVERRKRMCEESGRRKDEE